MTPTSHFRALCLRMAIRDLQPFSPQSFYRSSRRRRHRKRLLLKVPINELELQAVCFGLKSLCDDISNSHI